MDAAAYTTKQIAAILQLIRSMDPYAPDEDMMEVLIGAVTAWGTVEAQLLYTALEAAFEDGFEITEPARARLNKLYELQTNLHEDAGADAPFNQMARQYIDGVKYHLAADVQKITPLVAQLPAGISRELADSMAAMKLELE